MKTKVISARVPIDVAEAFESACKHKGLTKSKYLTNIMSTPNTYELQTMSQGGLVVDDIKLPEEVKTILSTSGGLLIGSLVYKSIQMGLQDKPQYTKEDVNLYAIIGAVACGLGSAFGIHAMLQD